MSYDLIASDAQQQEIDPFIELFEVVLNESTTLYFHAGVQEDLTEVQFRDFNSPYSVQTYLALPIIIEGIEANSDGAQNRPTLTAANVAATLRDLLGVEGMSNDSLIGCRVTRRQTLKKYLVGESDDTSPPVEFPRKVYLIDRVAAENNIAVKFELTSPFDITGIEIPNRVVVGKYCSWKYQSGGCYWPSNSILYYKSSSSTAIAHKAYFNTLDEPLVPSSSVSGAYAGGTTYVKGDIVSYSSKYWKSSQNSNIGNTPVVDNAYWDIVRIHSTWSSSSISYTASAVDPATSSYVEYSNTIWRCTKSHTSAVGKEPEVGSLYWIRGDVCGKQLSSCKCRFQFTPKNIDSTNSVPLAELDTSKQLPFGGFPGVIKFK